MPSNKVKSAELQRPIPKPRKVQGRSAFRNSALSKDAGGSEELQKDVRASLDAFMSGTPFRNGKLGSGEIRSDPSDIEHNLGGEADGFIVVSLKPLADPPAAPPVIYEVAQAPGRLNTHIRLASTEPVQATLWIWRGDDGSSERGTPQ